MTYSAQSLVDILKNLVLACEANGLGSQPFVEDARNVIKRMPWTLDESVVAKLRDSAARKVENNEDAALMLMAADALEASAKAVGWETTEEWEMEIKAFHACGRSDVPEDVQQLVAQLWKQYCEAAAPTDECETSAPSE